MMNLYGRTMSLLPRKLILCFLGFYVVSLEVLLTKKWLLNKYKKLVSILQCLFEIAEIIKCLLKSKEPLNCFSGEVLDICFHGYNFLDYETTCSAV